MIKLDDAELLRLYAADRSEAPFAELVRRHLNPVHAVALRQVGGDAHLAEDVVQLVFTALARKAAQLADRPVLGGWLYRTTQFAARDVVRAESRRRTREQAAQVMHEATTDDRADIDWDQLRPELDRMMMELRDADHDAIWLRFFEGRSFAEIGTALNLTENTARMRVERALAKLRAQLGRRGVTSTTAALTAALAVQPGEAAPAGLVASVTGAALAGVAGGSEAVVTAQFFALNKIQVGILSAVLGVGLVTGLMQARTNRRLWTEFNARRAEHARLEEQPPAASERPAAASVEAGELERLRARVALLKARPDGVVDAEMKPRGAWQNAGHATPEAAMETLAWATETGELDTLAESYSFNETTKARAEAFFASLSDAARTKYRTPERLFAPLLAEGWKQISPAAYQVSELIDQGANQVELQLWTRSTAGVERDGGRMPFVHEAEGWRFGRIGLDLDLARFDPVTGEFLPERK